MQPKDIKTAINDIIDLRNLRISEANPPERREVNINMGDESLFNGTATGQVTGEEAAVALVAFTNIDTDPANIAGRIEQAAKRAGWKEGQPITPAAKNEIIKELNEAASAAKNIRNK